jgi:hypothetical protein
MRGSVVFSNESDTVWAVRVTGNSKVQDIVQEKRRDGEATSLRVRYHADSDDGPISLEGEGQVAQADTAADQLSQALADFMSSRPSAMLSELYEVGKSIGQSERSVKRALQKLRNEKAVIRFGRGLYRHVAVRDGGALFETP